MKTVRSENGKTVFLKRVLFLKAVFQKTLIGKRVNQMERFLLEMKKGELSHWLQLALLMSCVL
jgi:hypothetical protein